MIDVVSTCVGAPCTSPPLHAGCETPAEGAAAVENIRQICQNVAKYPPNSPKFQSKFRTHDGGLGGEPGVLGLRPGDGLGL